MPRPRFATADADLRQRILEAARTEFAAKGYDAASLNQILLASGLSKGSFYYYFDDKLDLATTVFLEAAGPMSEVGELRCDVETVDAFWGELNRFTYDRLEKIDSKRAETELVMKLANVMLASQPLSEKILPAMAKGRAMVSAFMRRGVEPGAVRDDVPVETLLQLMQDLKMSLFKSMHPGDNVLTGAELRAFSDLVLDLCRRIASPKGKP